MMQDPERKSARQILKELEIDPIKSFGEIIQSYQEDETQIKDIINEMESPVLQADFIKALSDRKKVQIQALKEVMAISQKEDDQAIKLAELNLKQEQHERQLQKDAEQKNDSKKEKSITYESGQMETLTLEDGRQVVRPKRVDIG